MALALVVDEDADHRDTLCRRLEAEGYETQCAPNGREALAAVLAQVPDVILLEVFLPEMDGVSFLEVIRSYLRLSSVPVILLTGFPETPASHRAAAMGVVRVLNKKQYEMKDLLAAIGDALRSSAKR